MSRSLRIQYPGAFYHITCRGNEQNFIFRDDNDRIRFLDFLQDSLKTYHVQLFAYTLMNNHFHFLVQTMKANLSDFMRHFNIRYTGWFNYYHNRCGHLYQGRYKSFLIDADNYLLEVSRYLHLNITRVSKLRSKSYQHQWQYLRRYRWSSLSGYLSKNRINPFTNYDLVLSMVDGRHHYREFILDGLKRDMGNPFETLKEGVILGSDEFVLKVKDEYIIEGSLREQPSYRSLVADALDPKIVIDCVADSLGVDKSEFLVRLGNGVARGVASDLLYRYCGMNQIEIGKLLGGIDYSAVSQLRRRLKKKMVKDRRVMKQYVKAEGKVKELLSSVKI